MTREALLERCRRNVGDYEASEQSVGVDGSQVGPPWKAKSQLAGNRNCNTKARVVSDAMHTRKN
jgi:hypothetical protein